MVTVIRTEIDEATRHETEAVLRDIGITLPDAVAMMMRRIATEKRLPFALDTNQCHIIPNETTLLAMAEAEQSDLPAFDSVSELIDWLNADD